MFAALNISDSVERGFDVFFAWVPALVGAVVILIIGFFIAKLVQRLLAGGLTQADWIETCSPGAPASGCPRSPRARRD